MQQCTLKKCEGQGQVCLVKKKLEEICQCVKQCFENGPYICASDSNIYKSRFFIIWFLLLYNNRTNKYQHLVFGIATYFLRPKKSENNNNICTFYFNIVSGFR